MNRYVLGLIVLLNFGINYLSASEMGSAVVKTSYTYRNDQSSRALGVVPPRLHQKVDGLSYTVSFDFHFYGKTRTAEEILGVVIDNFDLNEFVMLRLCAVEEAVSADHRFTLAELGSIGSLTVDYRIEDNTLVAIQNRRIKWIVGQIVGNGEDTAESWMKTRRVSAFVEKNYFDEDGKPRSLSQLCDLVRNQRIIQ